jgi:hypothetical protein
MGMRGRVALMVLAVGLSAVGCGAGERERIRPVEAGEEAWRSLSSGWTRLQPPPFVRARAVSVWTGSELFYWGGDTDFGGTAHADGAAYDPAGGAWRRLLPGPLSGRSSAGAVWTGREVLIWGGGTESEGARSDGAAFDLATQSWRMLPESPLAPRDPVAAVWTGEEMLVWGNAARSADWVDGAAYDPDADRWRALPPAPLALNEATAVWTGEEMIVYGALLDGNNRSETEHAQGIAYRPGTNEWRVLPPFPLSPQASTAVWTGDELVVWDYELRAGAYDPAGDRWRPLPDLPLRFYECYPQGAQAGEGLVLAWHCGQAALLHLATGRWHALTGTLPEIFGRPVSAGSVVLFAGAAHEGVANALWAYKPDELEALTFVPRNEVRGGRVHLPVTFPDGTSAVLSYPSELDLAGMGVQPDVSYLYLDDPPPRFPLAFYRGDPPAGVVAGEAPIDSFGTREGGQAELWAAPADRDTEETGREVMPYRLVFRFGPWTVVAPVRDPDEARVLASSLDGHETPDGFVALHAFPPIGLSDESGEGEGPRLTIGDTDPDPDRLRVDDRFRSIHLWVESCSDATDRLSSEEYTSPSGWYAHRCLGGALTAQIDGDRKFVEAVYSGLEARDIRPGSA